LPIQVFEKVKVVPESQRATWRDRERVTMEANPTSMCKIKVWSGGRGQRGVDGVKERHGGPRTQLWLPSGLDRERA
jgi:hypothetical protein